MKKPHENKIMNIKKTFVLIATLILAFSINAFAQKAKPANSSKTKKSVTATELFKILPSDYVNASADKRVESLVFPVKSESDYLKFMLAGERIPTTLRADFREPEGLVDMRVFRGSSSIFVGLRYQIGDAKKESPTVDSVKITTFLLAYKQGKWTDVSTLMLPTMSVAEAHTALSKSFPEVKKDSVWLETQILEDMSGVSLVGRMIGNEFATPLKRFKWNGGKFVEIRGI
ncbi:MAG: hypothetical protein QM785_10015 [Pyrinomonadaceae bacterium]